MCSEVEIDAVKNQSFLENDGSEHCYQVKEYKHKSFICSNTPKSCRY